MLKEEVFYHLSLLSYFDCYETGITVSDMIQMILSDEQLLSEHEGYEDFFLNIEILKNIPLHQYENIIVREYYDDNLYSGIVYYIFEIQGELIYAFRGSEGLDNLHHTTAWQDWKDNFQMFLKKPTFQQMLSLHQVQNHNIDKPFYLCGHSKGGNLALFVSLTMKQELADQLLGVISFNAPGITKTELMDYQNRANDPEYLKKLTIFENENDCISSYFENLKAPLYIQSNWPCNTVEQIYHNHNLYAMDFTNNFYVLAEKKTAIPKIVYHFINDFFMNLKEDRLDKVVSRMDDYFESGLSLSELYKVLIYHISQYTSLFEDIGYEEIKTITFQDLIDRRKTKNLMAKVKEIQPATTVKKMASSISNVNPVQLVNEIDIKEVTQGFIDNYDLLKKETSKNIQGIVSKNNERITNAMKSIRNRKDKEDV